MLPALKEPNEANPHQVSEEGHAARLRRLTLEAEAVWALMAEDIAYAWDSGELPDGWSIGACVLSDGSGLNYIYDDATGTRHIFPEHQEPEDAAKLADPKSSIWPAMQQDHDDLGWCFMVHMNVRIGTAERD